MSTAARIKFAKEDDASYQEDQDPNAVYQHIGTFRKKPPATNRHSRIRVEDQTTFPSRILKQTDNVQPSSLSSNNLQSIQELSSTQTDQPLTDFKPSEQPTALNVGIYLDQTDIAVGSTLSTRIKDLQVHLALPANITFTENKIQIGQPKSDQPQFSIHQLLQDHLTSKYNVSTRAEEMLLSPEEILAIFFKKLLSRVTKITQLPIDSIVFVIPFTTTSLGKERLKQGLAMAGYYNTRVLSSNLSAALWFGLYDNHFTTTSRQQKFFLVVHSLQHSFSMAVVRVGKTSVSIKRCLLSESLSVCREKTFKTGHALMFSDAGPSQIEKEIEKVIFNAYITGLNQIMTEFGSKQIHRVIGIARSRNDTNLKRILSCFFGDKILTMLNSNGPFVGACLLSSQNDLAHTIFPSNVQVMDASRSDVVLLHNSKKIVIPLKNKKFILGKAAVADIPVSPEGTTLEVLEEFRTGSVVVREYFLKGKNSGGSEGSMNVKCDLTIAQDGVYNITACLPKKQKLVQNNLPLTSRMSPETITRLGDEFNFTDLSCDTSNEELKFLTNEAVNHYRAVLKTLRGRTLEEVAAQHDNIKEGVEERFKAICMERCIDGEKNLLQLRKLLDSVLNFVLLSQRQKEVMRWYDDKYLQH